MQSKSLHIKSYRRWAINEPSSTEALARLKKLALFDKLTTTAGTASITTAPPHEVGINSHAACQTLAIRHES